MLIPLVDLKAQFESLRGDLMGAMQKVCEESAFIQGKYVAQFEQEFASYLGVQYCAGVSSGTAALRLALEAVGVGEGDEVITVSHTFFATVEAILQLKAIPKLIDIDPVSYTMDVTSLESAYTHRTKAIIPVHLYGRPAEMEAIQKFAKAKKLWVIEDAAQAHGATYHGKKCGSIGDVGCFSFYPGKNLGAYGDGGAVVTSHPEIHQKLLRLRDHGREAKFEHLEVGYGDRLDGIQAAILLVKLPFLDEWNAKRAEHVREYCERLQLPLQAKSGSCHHLFVIRVLNRDKLLAELKENGIEAGIHYPIPAHEQPVFKKIITPNLRLPETIRAASEILSLPLYPELTSQQIQRVVSVINAGDRKLVRVASGGHLSP